MSDSNVDTAEIAKFNAIARRWWDKDSEFKPLHAINPLRLSYITDRVDLMNAKVLDVGCGGGILAESLAANGARVTGIDMGETALQVAKLHLYESNLSVDYQQRTVESLAAEEAQQYDVITCLEMLEHVPDPGSIIASCAKLLKPGGHLFVSTINRNPKAYLFAILGAEYLLNMLPKGTHDYEKLITPAEMGRYLRDSHFDLQDVTGMTFNPITGVYKLSADASVNYLAHARGQS